MIDNECNILSNMSKTEFREFRSLMVEMVLHTGDLPYIALQYHIDCHTLPYIDRNGVGHWCWIDCHPASECKNFFSDMSMHFSQLKSMKNLVAASNVDKGR